jgi:hypothetical protein
MGSPLSTWICPPPELFSIDKRKTITVIGNWKNKQAAMFASSGERARPEEIATLQYRICPLVCYSFKYSRSILLQGK